jgi:hypothetical protein
MAQALVKKQQNQASDATAQPFQTEEKKARLAVLAEASGVVALSRFIEVAATAMGRATFYNTKEEQEAAETALHDQLFSMDRGLYALMAGLPGASDRSLQKIFERLLENPRDGKSAALLNQEEESKILAWICQQLPVTRMLKLFVQMQAERINNARTRKLILRSVLGSPRLALWCTRYRKKLYASLCHAWNQRNTGILRSILRKAPDTWDAREKAILESQILRYAPKDKQAQLLDCVRFLLGLQEDLQSPLLRSYHEAKKTLEAGSRLPYETLEGIRSVYHKERSSAEVLEITKAQLTKQQKMVLQRKAEESGVSVEMDPMDYDAIKLYIYAFSRGLTAEIREALREKAKKAAARFPTRFGRLGILLDASASMKGDETQALRPMAISLALRDMLREIADEAVIQICGGRQEGEEDTLITPEGETSLASGLIAMLKQSVDAIFVLSDGYENAPAGRFAEVLTQIRKLGFNLPIYQMSPVLAAEDAGIRALSKEEMSALPVSSPDQMGLSFIHAMLLQEPQRALPLLCQALWKQIALPSKPSLSLSV